MKTITPMRALLAGIAIAASAVSTTALSEVGTARFNFGGAPLPSGSFNPGSTFAQLSITPAGFNVFNFTVISRDLDRLFTSGAFIGAIAIDSTPNISARDVSISNFHATGVDRIVVVDRGGPGTGLDFRFRIGTGGVGSDLAAHRFGANESASWTASFNSPSAVQFSGRGIAMDVQGLSASQGGGAWYSASAAPEPEIYAMMLSGLLLVGFATRRSRRRSAS